MYSMTSTEDKSIEERSFDEISDYSKLKGRTPMSDQPFYAPNRTIAPRQPRAGERLWTGL